MCGYVFVAAGAGSGKGFVKMRIGLLKNIQRSREDGGGIKEGSVDKVQEGKKGVVAENKWCPSIPPRTDVSFQCQAAADQGSKSNTR